MANYDKSPYTIIENYDQEAFAGYAAIVEEIKRKTADRIKTVIACEFYPGVNSFEVKKAFDQLPKALVIESESCAKDEETLQALFADELTEDRVFGVITNKKLIYCFEAERIEQAKRQVEAVKSGLVLIYGTGASFIGESDLLIYFDMERWEIQKRYRAGMANWNCTNTKAPILSKYKRGFFIEWRLADKRKKELFSKVDYFVDTGTENSPNMLTAKAYLIGMEAVSQRPFRTVPYFDPGVWGGNWMKQKFDLEENGKNYAWSFDGVPEENSLQLKYGEVIYKQPCINLVFLKPQALLGERVHARFGTEFPIRFDLLDTMGGENLSLQVHPLTEYIQENFHVNYTQDESYYILDTGEDGCVYIGLKEGVDRDEMISDLRRAEHGEISFPVEKYINKIAVKKHDHILIPAGTIHCSSGNTMVLEISATPYIFTFKLWDWDRLGMDGLPRPIHVEHGIKNIQWDRDYEWVQKNLVGQVEVIDKTKDSMTERTGLHEREFVDVFRHSFTEKKNCLTKGSVNVLNLVEGEQVIVCSESNQFPDFKVNYGETFIIPASVECFTLKAVNGNEKPIKVLQALVR